VICLLNDRRYKNERSEQKREKREREKEKWCEYPKKEVDSKNKTISIRKKR
jgi:hypothetical protein